MNINNTSMNIADLENIYDHLADKIDAAGNQSELFLAKLVLILSNQIKNPSIVLDAITNASQDL